MKSNVQQTSSFFPLKWLARRSRRVESEAGKSQAGFWSDPGPAALHGARIALDDHGRRL